MFGLREHLIIKGIPTAIQLSVCPSHVHNQTFVFILLMTGQC